MDACSSCVEEIMSLESRIRACSQIYNGVVPAILLATALGGCGAQPVARSIPAAPAAPTAPTQPSSRLCVNARGENLFREQDATHILVADFWAHRSSGR